MSVTSIHACGNITAIVKYCITPKKTQEKKRVGALYSDLGDADNFLAYSNLMLKNTSRKVQGYVLLQSFRKDEFDIRNQEHISIINELGKKLARGLYPNSPVLVITHNDSEGECLHNHIVVLNHDLVTGKAIAQNRRFCEVKSYNDELMNKYGLEICQHSNTPKTQGEYWSDKRNGWLGMLREGMDEALAKSTSLQEFQDKLLVEGISSNMQKKNGELKEHFSFAIIDSDGKTHKKRSDSLGEEYTREKILRRLESNAKEAQLQSIIPMSEWILLNEKSNVSEENVMSEMDCGKIETNIVNETMITVTEKVVADIPMAETSVSDGDNRKEMEFIMKKQIDNLRMMREAEHQELLREIKKITLQIDALKEIFEREEDSDEDLKALTQLECELDNLKLKEFRMSHEGRNSEPLNERLMPTFENIREKDNEMSF